MPPSAPNSKPIDVTYQKLRNNFHIYKTQAPIIEELLNQAQQELQEKGLVLNNVIERLILPSLISRIPATYDPQENLKKQETINQNSALRQTRFQQNVTNIRKFLSHSNAKNPYQESQPTMAFDFLNNGMPHNLCHQWNTIICKDLQQNLDYLIQTRVALAQTVHKLNIAQDEQKEVAQRLSMISIFDTFKNDPSPDDSTIIRSISQAIFGVDLNCASTSLHVPNKKNIRPWHFEASQNFQMLRVELWGRGKTPDVHIANPQITLTILKRTDITPHYDISNA